MPTVIIVGGPSGTGKTTTAALLASHFDCPYIEGDELHPEENVAKMARGEPLTDDDRWGWLKKISRASVGKAADPANKSGICVASCSMLKRAYRDYLLANGNGADFRFVFLHASFESIIKRVAARQNHFLKLNMVKSQFDIMDVPKSEELIRNGGKAIAVDCETGTPQQLAELIVHQLDV
ncbi:carbohydrate kinase [Metschnikowia bicuspidata var. bicuspidata NRRL YB-4993]|uniref:Gluconokinase n=1 Tax=Metschnikowia bicuspidata var. bicuspidata NRRL YB-4993 TaxID=869754 RepID=A0A1A0HKL6_9ASCO|nr:carbohydrate kinase [Metschnikowia bicuspidata var. bicuspidata NRRL YB-4993]OBA24570.1 carbohydrate kinase [Metschnikowia bicuspidata var. bicuspidata NRRL YB-4993]